LPGDLRRFSRLNRDDVFLLKLEITNFFEVDFGQLFVRFKQLNIVIVAHNWKSAFTFENVLHLIPGFRDEKI
jgi:hypothetical protein